MTTKVLFVCLGNICRSPTAESVMRTKALEQGHDITVDSAGTSDWHIGSPPYGPMTKAAEKRGYDMAPLRARLFLAQDFTDFDLIITMDDANTDNVEALRPPSSKTTVRKLLSFSDASVDDVPDPYYTRDFDGALDMITAAAKRLLADISGSQAR